MVIVHMPQWASEVGKGLGLVAAGHKVADDRKTVGVFLRMSKSLDGKFPDTKEDSSPAHATLLFVGPADDGKHRKVVSAVREVAKKVAPFKLEVTDYGEFKNKEGKTIPHMVPRSHGVSLEELHKLLRKAVEKRGVPIEHRDGPFKSHVTLAYVPKGKTYNGPRPSGTFQVKTLEVWTSRNEDHSDRDSIKVPLTGMKKESRDPSPDKLSTKVKVKAPSVPPTAPHPSLASVAAAATKGQYTPVKAPNVPKRAYAMDNVLVGFLDGIKQAQLGGGMVIKTLGAAGLLGTAFFTGKEWQRLQRERQEQLRRQAEMRRQILSQIYGL